MYVCVLAYVRVRVCAYVCACVRSLYILYIRICTFMYVYVEHSGGSPIEYKTI